MRIARLSALFIAPLFLPTAALAHHGPESVVLPAKMGQVIFQHFAHQDRVADCERCHHTGVEAAACRSCHGEKPEAPKAKDAFHALCRGCHQEQGAGPTRCPDCHRK